MRAYALQCLSLDWNKSGLFNAHSTFNGGIFVSTRTLVNNTCIGSIYIIVMFMVAKSRWKN